MAQDLQWPSLGAAVPCPLPMPSSSLAPLPGLSDSHPASSLLTLQVALSLESLLGAGGEPHPRILQECLRLRLESSAPAGWAS